MARQTRSGLGRGLGALMGTFDSVFDAEPQAPAQTPEQTQQPAPAPAPAPAPQPARQQVSAAPREVIRESDLSQEDRVIIGMEAKERPQYANTPAQQRGAIHPERKPQVVERAVEPVAAVVSEPTVRVIEKEVVVEKTTDEVPIDMIHPNPNQPRTHFDEEELLELVSSIQKDGLLQPILVREQGDGYEIIAGERRWQASKRAGLLKVPVRIKEADDYKVLELALIENLQRSDLNPIEEAYGYKRMMERGNKTQSEVAAAVSKGRSTIANALRLLELPTEAQQLLFERVITAGHARAILSIPSAEGRKKLTDRLKEEKLSVREAEAIARLLALKERPKTPSDKAPTPKAFTRSARSLGRMLSTKVRVRNVGGKNKIEIEFKDEEDLQRLMDILKQS